MSAISGSLGGGRCIFIVSRQNPVLVGYFFAFFSHVATYRDKITVFSQYKFVSVGMFVVNLSVGDYVFQARYQVFDGREIFIIDMLVENVAETATFITPNHIYVSDVLSVEYAKQISAFVIGQELNGLDDLSFELVIHASEYAPSYRLWFIALAITELRLSEPCLSPHHLGVGCVEHGWIAAVLLALVGFVQHKCPFLIAPFLLAGDLQSVQQLLQGFLKHGFQLAPERQFLGTHLLEATLADASGKVCTVFLGGVTSELLAFLACLQMGFCHVCIIRGVAVLALRLMLLAFLLAQSVHLRIVHLLCHAVNGLLNAGVRHTVEFVKGIVELLLFGEQYAQSVMTHNLMHKRVFHVCQVRVVRHDDGHLARQRVEAALHPALACAWQCGHFSVSADNAHWCVEAF